MTTREDCDIRYWESHIQKGFVTWFAGVAEYKERYEDADTQQNTAMDSAGFIGPRPVLIEVKVHVGSSMVRPADRRQGILERKLLRAVRDLYQGATTPKLD